MDPKRALRAEMKALREGLSPAAHAEKSARIGSALLAFCASRRIHRVGAFWPYRSEVDLRGAFAARPDWLWFFPKVTSTTPPRLAWGTEPLEPGMWGLMEPGFAQHFLPPAELLLVPGLAFDPRGYRLGYGGGFYDALINELPEGITTLAIGFGCQRVDELPLEPRDLPVDGLLTEDGISWF